MRNTVSRPLAVQHFPTDPRRCAAHGQPHHQLQHQLERKASLLPETQQAHGNNRQHIGHGVIAAALHLQQRCRSLLQIQLVLSQDGKYAGSIRTGQHRSHQEPLLPGKAK